MSAAPAAPQGADLAGDEFRTTVAVEVAPLDLDLNDWQLARLRGIVAEAAAAAREEDTGPAPEAAAAAAATVQGGKGSGDGDGGIGATPSPRGPHHHHRRRHPERPQAKALGVFGGVWDFLVNEAEYIEATEGGSPAAAAAAAAEPLPPMHAELHITLLGGQEVRPVFSSCAWEGWRVAELFDGDV